jgi:hypothetical protein
MCPASLVRLKCMRASVEWKLKQGRHQSADPDYSVVPPWSSRVRVGTSTEHLFSFCESHKPESNRHLQIDETGMLPLHHRGLTVNVCEYDMFWKEVGETMLPSCALLSTAV